MFSLSNNWITEGTIDFEYKKYLLLAYLRDIDASFKDEKLYPQFAELIQHHRNLVHLKYELEKIETSFQKELKEMDLQHVKLIFEKLKADNVVDEIQSIIDYSLPEMETEIKKGAEIYDEVEHKLHVFSLGLIPLYKDDGYFIISDFVRKNILIYEYQFSLITNKFEQFRTVKTNYLKSYKLNISNTYEKIKYDLIRFNSNNSTPATFVVEFKENIPYRETLLPIAKRSLVQFISSI
ncbi:MAG: hypothetical protein RL065_281 [Bacteroidota bacterium]|jgi:hypothetical protein